MATVRLILQSVDFDEKRRVRWETKLYEGKPAWVQYYTTNNGRTWKQGIVVYMD